VLGDQELVAFVGVSDLDRAHQFYGGVLGLHRVDSSEYANLYMAGGAQLRVTRVPKPAAAPYTVLGWRVDDIATAVRELTTAGVRPNRYQGMDQDELGVWMTPAGALVVWFSDPDGNTLSLQQPPG
jgi:catechol 2,3-dioxygenase-like lactoylglutathione lyase family enzyme